jgi:sorting nexin-1/2
LSRNYSITTGRFEEQFVETRRAALERTVGKMANHPVLSLDPDLKLFLSSEAFSIDVSSVCSLNT